MPIRVGIFSTDSPLSHELRDYFVGHDLIVKLFEKTDDVKRLDVVLIFTDFAGGGYSFCQQTRETNSTLPIAILSNERAIGEEVKANFAGANAVFKIPFDPAHLLKFVQVGSV